MRSYADNSVYRIWPGVIFTSFRNVHDSSRVASWGWNLLNGFSTPRPCCFEACACVRYLVRMCVYVCAHVGARARACLRMCARPRHAMETICLRVAINRSLNCPTTCSCKRHTDAFDAAYLRSEWRKTRYLCVVFASSDCASWNFRSTNVLLAFHTLLRRRKIKSSFWFRSPRNRRLLEIFFKEINEDINITARARVQNKWGKKI